MCEMVVFMEEEFECVCGVVIDRESMYVMIKSVKVVVLKVERFVAVREEKVREREEFVERFIRDVEVF